MSDAHDAAMREATRLTRAGRLEEATRLIQELLRGRAPREHTPDKAEGPASAGGLRGLLDRLRPRRAPAPEPTSPGGRFIAGSYADEHGSRDYRLYVPSGYRGMPVPLLVMLHGCTQSPQDFAAGTRMNGLAEERTFLVLYPAQSQAANGQRCWNWFNPDDQRRGRGEPALIAGMTEQVMRDHAVQPRQIWIAGLSAGGAAAAVAAQAYPDLFAAVGVHSGVPCGVAHDVASAFGVMREGTRRPALRPGQLVPTIVFHGDQDRTVHPSNGDGVIAQAATAAGGLRVREERGRVPGGHGWRRLAHLDATGRTILEQWVVEGAGHAWSGGSPQGSFTDPRGPDASREMLRFFLER